MKKLKFLSALKFITILIVLIVIYPRVINAQFAYGADIGWLSEMEDSGRAFKDNSGIEKDCLEILKGKGINALRFRVWVNPQNKYCGKKDVVYMAQRANNLGFQIMLDFHLSDSWADPEKQTKPAAWKNDSFVQLQADVYDHIYNVLDTLKSIGIIPKWVQIGNETNDGMLWDDGQASKNMSNFAALINSGYNAVKAVDNSIQVIVQLSNGYDNSLYTWLFKGLVDKGAKWDIIGLSVYPYGSDKISSWQEYNSKTFNNMADLITRYNTKVMVCETGYPHDQPAVAKSFLSDLISKTKLVGGLGVFYWEPECYNWQNYSLGAWDPNTQEPTIALDAFWEASPVSVKEDKIPKNYNLNIYPNPFNPTTNIEYEIRNSSNVKIVIYDVLGREVGRLVDEYKNPGNYKAVWNANNFPGGVYLCRMQTQNFEETKKIILVK